MAVVLFHLGISQLQGGFIGKGAVPASVILATIEALREKSASELAEAKDDKPVPTHS